MSNGITDARNAVAAVLNGLAIPDLYVYPYYPESLSTPSAVVFADDDYLTPGQSFGDWDVSLKVRLFLGTGDNDVMTETLDALIVEVTNALRKTFGSARSGRPAVDRESFDSPYYTADISVATLTFKGGN